MEAILLTVPVLSALWGILACARELNYRAVCSSRLRRSF